MGVQDDILAGVPMRITDIFCDIVKNVLAEHWQPKHGVIFFEVFWDPRTGLGILLVVPAPDDSGFLIAWPEIPSPRHPTRERITNEVREGLRVLEEKSADVKAGRSTPRAKGFFG